ncbi:uncharacterized protein [Lepeophtheirus salmonis]|uniref:uncharacterized protein n=1 Tax=Lepeophtheirus salmonis TaxID=72036 RepID=UPI003AF36878
MLEPGEVTILVVEYFVENALPLSTVESPAFQKLVSKIPVWPSDKLKTNLSCTTRKHLDIAYEAMKKELKKKIDAQEYVYVTADIKTINNKSFMGVTIHWIDADTLKRQNIGIAYKRFRGRHTYNALATDLEDIFFRYGLNSKVTPCVTDNGSNFVKAFKEFQQAQPESHEEQEEEASEVTFTDLHNVLTTATDDDDCHSICALPPHHSSPVYRSTTGKYPALWTKGSRSTVALEYLEEFNEKKEIVPSVTRWNSFYDAYAHIIEMPLPTSISIAHSLT